MGALLHDDQTLSPPFSRVVLPTASINFRPDAVTFEHVDSNNLMAGICGILAGRTFDHTRGGHLILHLINLAIQFLAGALVFLQHCVTEMYAFNLKNRVGHLQCTQLSPFSDMWSAVS